MRCEVCGFEMTRLHCGGPSYCDHCVSLTVSCDKCSSEHAIEWECGGCNKKVCEPRNESMRYYFEFQWGREPTEITWANALDTLKKMMGLSTCSVIKQGQLSDGSYYLEVEA